ncbi:hypothetical protein ACSBL2_18835 [Pedobacter sp. AW31-3R]|uniref:hypothetical protein n=1 Tax=Pedobacter sp. AW31-3R TaxID=3445781 RepID=UPI003FA10A50
MKTYMPVLFLIFSASLLAAQGKIEPAKKAGPYGLLVKRIVIGGTNYQLYKKDIRKATVEPKIPTEDPDAPQVVTALKKMMDYDRKATGEEYALYSINRNGKKNLELTFPKKIRNADHKIETEGTYLVNDKTLIITFKRFDYHFPTIMTTVYNLTGYGNLSFIKREEISLETDGFSDEYVKKVEPYTIKAN